MLTYCRDSKLELLTFPAQKLDPLRYPDRTAGREGMCTLLTPFVGPAVIVLRSRCISLIVHLPEPCLRTPTHRYCGKAETKAEMSKAKLDLSQPAKNQEHSFEVKAPCCGIPILGDGPIATIS